MEYLHSVQKFEERKFSFNKNNEDSRNCQALIYSKENLLFRDKPHINNTISYEYSLVCLQQLKKIS